MKAFSGLALLILFAQGSFAYAQNGKWRSYSPPHSGFSIETPAPLRKVMSFDGEHGVNYDPEQDRQGISSYAAIETNAEECRFGIIVISARTRAMFLRSQPRDKLFWYLSVVLIGDDDDPEPDIEKVFHLNGLTGKEYFFIRERQDFPNGGSTGDIFTRGRILDTGNKIYVLVFVGKGKKDLDSPDAEHFLNSFRPLRRVS